MRNEIEFDVDNDDDDDNKDNVVMTVVFGYYIIVRVKIIFFFCFVEINYICDWLYLIIYYFVFFLL